jgi:hypothetical protein
VFHSHLHRGVLTFECCVTGCAISLAAECSDEASSLFRFPWIVETGICFLHARHGRRISWHTGLSIHSPGYACAFSEQSQWRAETCLAWPDYCSSIRLQFTQLSLTLWFLLLLITSLFRRFAYCQMDLWNQLWSKRTGRSSPSHLTRITEIDSSSGVRT